MVNGWCMGGGNELALWCDIVVASDNAVFGQTGAKVGACPTVGATQYLPRIIGERLAREMIFCARKFTAKEAATDMFCLKPPRHISTLHLADNLTATAFVRYWSNSGQR
jgi:1,4-dihydroxy-2-naphthoyl-CoA synthase